MTQTKKQGKFQAFLNFIEVVGNKLPDPVSIFIGLTLVFMLISWILSVFDISVIHPLSKKTIHIVNMLSVESLQGFLGSVVKNFQAFPPLGLVLVVMIGAGVADKTGLMTALLKRSIAKTPKKLITATVVFMGILANAAGDAGFIVLPPLAAMIYASVGRHPLLGIFVSFASIAAGFSANIFVNMLDILLASFTLPAAQLIDPSYNQTPAMNYYFLLASSLVLVAVSVFVTEKIVEPRLGEYEGKVIKYEEDDNNLETRGLKFAGISFLVLVLIIISLCLGEKPFLADPKTGSLLAYTSYLMKGMIPIVTALFLVPGIFYGIGAKTIKNDKDIISMMSEAMSDLGSYIVLVFFAAQFLTVFSTSNLGIVLAIKGAEFLEAVGFSGIWLIISFIILSGFLNIFVGSASAKWAILAPVFVPMFLLLGYDPALTQVAYRIGDSVTNPISPLFPYFPILLAFAKKYEKDIGIGKIISNMMPYSISFFILWVAVLIIFILFNLPLGPGAGVYIN